MFIYCYVFLLVLYGQMLSEDYMEPFAKNLVDFRCYSNGNNEINSGISAQNTHSGTYKLIYIYRGLCRINIDGKDYNASEGYSVLVFPCCEFDIDETPGVRYTWIEFSGFESAAILGRTAFSKKNPMLGTIDMDGFEDLFEMPVNSGEPYSNFRLGGCIMLLLSYYMEKFPGKSFESEGYVYKACHFINQNYSQHGFCVKDVVESLKIDRSYLYRIFKNETGVSVIDYITRCRIAKAEILLANSNLSIKDVAYSVGFNDQMYFSRVFKKLNGRTPTSFRERIFKSR